MGKPAARATDMALDCADPTDTPTGVVIAVSTVFINKLPAAKKGDQIVGVDVHIVMIPSPGGPIPTPLPHPFAGMIDNAVSSSVNIMGMPAATQDSTASAVPPHIPQGGPFQKPPANKATIKIGSPTVLFGDSGGGGGASGSGGMTKAKAKAAAVEVEQGHYLDVKFVDKGNKPIMGAAYSIKTPDNRQVNGPLVGQVKQKGVKEGSHEIKLRAIVDVRWADPKAQVGDKVKLTVETAGIEDGEKALLRIFVKDANFVDHEYEALEAEVESDKIEKEWELKIDERLLDHQDSKAKGGRYSVPYFYFVAEVGGLRQKSALLKYTDWIEVKIKDADDNAIANKKFKLFFPNGEVREGTLDSQGKARVENVPAGRANVAVDPRE
jgi:uncharacterized Zn-binding protein involved in type VI secretion